MMNRFLLVLLLMAGPAAATTVTIETPLGSFDVELFDDEAPGTVANFLNYVNDGDYQDAFIHRSVTDFVIQGGGFNFVDDVVGSVPTDDPIQNEFGRSNTRGTIAMAKLGGDPDSATSQWFINLGDNSGNLDDQNGGFTVFGQVVGDGMAVVDAIAALQIWNAGSPFGELPLINYSGSGNIEAQHLVFTDISVVPEGVMGPTFEINPGISGAWFNADTAGQGWLIDVIQTAEGLQLFVAWFTYADQEPDAAEMSDFGTQQHRWFTAIGPVMGDTAEMAITLNTGGVFNDTRATDAQTVGTMTMQFSDCTNAVLTFAFDDGPSGEIAVIRLSPDVFCTTLTGE